MRTRHGIGDMLSVSAAIWLGLVLPAAAGAVTIDGRTAILIDSREPLPLRKAAEDLAADFGRVFGRQAKIVRDPRETGSSVVWIGLEHALPAVVARPSGWEQFQIQGVANPGSGSPAREAVVLTGSDVRGAIYAIYQFSQQFLGVDPLYWWTDQAPRRRSEAAVPDGLLLRSGPAFHFRGWFLNDEDLFTGWMPGTPEGTGISLELWDHIFEAILRLKGDMVVPGTWIFPYEPQIRAAGERGLIVTQHHVNTLGLDTYRWPKNKLMSYLSDPKSLEAAWRRGRPISPGPGSFVERRVPRSERLPVLAGRSECTNDRRRPRGHHPRRHRQTDRDRSRYLSAAGDSHECLAGGGDLHP